MIAGEILNLFARSGRDSVPISLGAVGTGSGMAGFILTPDAVLRWVPFALGVMVSVITILCLVANRSDKRRLCAEELRLARLREMQTIRHLCESCQAGIRCPVECAVPVELRPGNCPLKVKINLGRIDRP